MRIHICRKANVILFAKLCILLFKTSYSLFFLNGFNFFLNKARISDSEPFVLTSKLNNLLTKPKLYLLEYIAILLCHKTLSSFY